MSKITIIYTFFLLLNLNTFYQAVADNWNTEELNTAARVSYLSDIEKEIILEMNKLRSDPARYAREYIAPLAKHYNNRILHYPGDQPLITKEGVSALHECVRELKKKKQLPLLIPSPGLSLAARDHVKDQSHTGDTGHTGSDKSSMRDRIERYGKWEKSIAENIAYGAGTARQIVIYLLIDDGVPGRGHRDNFMNPGFKTTGVATGNHLHYGLMGVIEFAGGYKTIAN